MRWLRFDGEFNHESVDFFLYSDVVVLVPRVFDVAGTVDDSGGTINAARNNNGINYR
jgi:hypothetical protein